MEKRIECWNCHKIGTHIAINCPVPTVRYIPEWQRTPKPIKEHVYQVPRNLPEHDNIKDRTNNRLATYIKTEAEAVTHIARNPIPKLTLEEYVVLQGIKKEKE